MGMRSSWRPLLSPYYWHARKNSSIHFTWSWQCNNALQLEMWKVCACYVSQQLTEKTSKNLWRTKCIRRDLFWYVEYFFILQNFKKRTVFSEKTVKNCFGGTFDHFVGKGGVLPQKLIYLFYHKLDPDYLRKGNFCFWLNVLIRDTFRIVLIY